MKTVFLTLKNCYLQNFRSLSCHRMNLFYLWNAMSRPQRGIRTDYSSWDSDVMRGNIKEEEATFIFKTRNRIVSTLHNSWHLHKAFMISTDCRSLVSLVIRDVTGNWVLSDVCTCSVCRLCTLSALTSLILLVWEFCVWRWMLNATRFLKPVMNPGFRNVWSA